MTNTIREKLTAGARQSEVVLELMTAGATSTAAWQAVNTVRVAMLTSELVSSFAVTPSSEEDAARHEARRTAIAFELEVLSKELLSALA